MSQVYSISELQHVTALLIRDTLRSVGGYRNLCVAVAEKNPWARPILTEGIFFLDERNDVVTMVADDAGRKALVIAVVIPTFEKIRAPTRFFFEEISGAPDACTFTRST